MQEKYTIQTVSEDQLLDFLKNDPNWVSLLKNNRIFSISRKDNNIIVNKNYWYNFEGLLHRKDGPAIRSYNEYWLNGEFISQGNSFK